MTFLLPSPAEVVLGGSTPTLGFACAGPAAPLLFNTEVGCRLCFSARSLSPCPRASHAWVFCLPSLHPCAVLWSTETVSVKQAASPLREVPAGWKKRRVAAGLVMFFTHHKQSEVPCMQLNVPVASLHAVFC